MTHDPGGKVRIALADGVTSSADWGGPNKEYRYVLRREWDAKGNRVLFLMMNPSMGDEAADDPTVAKCGRFARKWGFGRLAVCNVFPYRATNQDDLVRAADRGVDPRGESSGIRKLRFVNHDAVWREAFMSDLVVCAYGTPRNPRLRSFGLALAIDLAKSATRLHVLRLSKAGVPVHPLYLPETLRPTPWNPMEPT